MRASAFTVTMPSEALPRPYQPSDTFEGHAIVATLLNGGSAWSVLALLARRGFSGGIVHDAARGVRRNDYSAERFAATVGVQRNEVTNASSVSAAWRCCSSRSMLATPSPAWGP